MKSIITPGSNRSLLRTCRRLGGAGLVLFFFATLACTQDSPASFDDLVAAAVSAGQQRDSATAIKLYSQAVQLRPEWPEGWWSLGVLHYETGEFSAGRDSLTRFIELTPYSGQALALRGLCEFETGEFQKSLQDIQRGLSLGGADKPRNEQILRSHEALLLTLTGNFEDALHDYDFFAHQGVTDPEMAIGIGLAGLRTQLLPRDLDTGQRDLFLAAGTAALHFMAGDEATAQQDFQNLFTRFPSAANAHYFYGYLLFAKDPDQAVKEFRRELEITPSSAPANLMLAWYLVLQNDAAKALPYAEKVLAEMPTSPSAQLVVGRSEVDTGNVNAGLEHLETAVKIDPGNLEVHLALAEAYSKSGHKQEARLERQECLQATQGEASAVAHP